MITLADYVAVQIPLWSIGTLCLSITLAAAISVQIPLWSIGTRLCGRSGGGKTGFKFLYGRSVLELLRGQLLLLSCSNSSMVDRYAYLQVPLIIGIAFKFLYGRSVPTGTLASPSGAGVQIPLWSIGTRSRMLCFSTSFSVQIPLWSIGTIAARSLARVRSCSNSSMVDRYVGHSYFQQRLQSLFKFLYGRSVPNGLAHVAPRVPGSNSSMVDRYQPNRDLWDVMTLFKFLYGRSVLCPAPQLCLSQHRSNSSMVDRYLAAGLTTLAMIKGSNSSMVDRYLFLPCNFCASSAFKFLYGRSVRAVRLQLLRDQRVQIPLWSIGTRHLKCVGKLSEHVQIPLWSIGTRAPTAL
ncbi:MAG: hypothetical protein PWP41_991 [Moorella sp. (in: firmicutes)]|nr:hypothetical protein [Moorella sp. (in: firmicutes)]